MDTEQLSQIVYYGTLAPTPHNLQGWRFIGRGGALCVCMDPERVLPVLDPTNREIYIGLGAAIENMRVAARHFGYRIDVIYFPEGEDSATVAVLRFDESFVEEDDEFELLTRRETNRRPFRREPLDPAAIEKLQAALAGEPEYQLHLLTERSPLRAAADLIREAEQTRYEHDGIYQELHEWLRFTQRQAETRRDGLSLASMEITEAPLQWVTGVLLSLPARRLLTRLRRVPGGGLSRTMARTTYRLVCSAPALGLLTSRRADNLHYVRGGEVFERVSHTVAKLGLAMQATSAPLELVHALKSGHEGMFNARERKRVRSLRKRLYELFPIDDATGLAMLFRLGMAPPPSARSPRRPVEAVFHYSNETEP
jgi:hypothetical protein